MIRKKDETEKNGVKLSPLLIISIILIILPIILGFSYVNSFSVNVPYYDQFYLDAHLYIKQADNSISIDDILRLHNDHRPIVPSLLILLNGYISNADNKSQVLMSYCIYILAFGILALMVFRTFPHNDFIPLIMIPTSFYFFNWYMLGSLLWGTGIYYSSFIFFVILSAYCLDKSEKIDRWFILAIIAAICCMFSFSSGLVIWFMGIIYLLILKKSNQIMKIIIWALSAGISFFIHFIYLGVHSEGIHGTSGYRNYIFTFIEYPLHKIICYIGVVGSTIIHEVGISILFGLCIIFLLIGVLIINRKNLHLKRTAIWYSLLGYSLIISMMLTLSRSGDDGMFGPATNLFFIPDNRHFANTILILLSLFLLVACYLFIHLSTNNIKINIKKLVKYYFSVDSLTINKLMFGFILALLIMGTYYQLSDGLEYGQNWNTQHKNNEKILVHYNYLADEELSRLHPRPDKVRVVASLMEEYRLGVFSNIDQSIRKNTLPKPIISEIIFYNIDSISAYSINDDILIRIMGWAFIEGRESNHNIHYIILTNGTDEFVFQSLNIFQRTDVTQYYNSLELNLDDSGFASYISIKSIPEGEYQIGIMVLTDINYSKKLTNTYVLWDGNSIEIRKVD